MAFTEFCCRAGGNNLNAGTLNGSSVEPSTSPVATFIGGSWNGTNIYTAPIGADLTEVIVGRAASLTPDSATIPTVNNYSVFRITAVNAGTREITIASPFAAMTWGTIQGVSAGDRTLRIGGAWSGPSGSLPFPFIGATVHVNLLNNANVRLNLKNDSTYNVTAQLIGSDLNVSGYGTSYGDRSRAIIDGGITGASYTLFTTNFGDGVAIVSDIWFRNNGATGSATGVIISSFQVYGAGSNLVVSAMKGTGLLSAGTLHECEVFCCGAGISATLSINCIAHDNLGVGFASGRCFHCIADSNSGHGFRHTANRSAAVYVSCDSYGNTGSGFRADGGNGGLQIIQNCNSVLNTRYGIELNGPNDGAPMVIITNCGTFNNSLGSIAEVGGAFSVYLNTGNVAYASNPYVDAANGNFQLSLASAKNSGRGSFVQTSPSYSGSIGYPDIGAVAATGGGGRPFHPLSTPQVIG